VSAGGFVGGAGSLFPAPAGSGDLRDVVLDFAVPVARVSIASGDTDESWTLKAYAGDELVASSVRSSVGDIAVTVVNVDGTHPSDWITRAVVDLQNGSTAAAGPEFFDLLQFDPVSVSSAVAAPAAHATGWNREDVTVALTATEEAPGNLADVVYESTGAQLTPLTTSEGSASLVVSTDGATTVTHRAVDCAGGTSSVGAVVVQLDKTAPEVVYSGNAGTYRVDETVAISCAASDATSGLASDSCEDIAGAAYEFGVGSDTRSASALDVAGNEGSGSTTFEVRVDYDSLCGLTRQFVAESGVGDGLCAKLRAAQASADRGNQASRGGQLEAYRKHVAAQAGKALTTSEAATLAALSTEL
jgi:hypothetical protein